MAAEQPVDMRLTTTWRELVEQLQNKLSDTSTGSLGPANVTVTMTASAACAIIDLYTRQRDEEGPESMVFGPEHGGRFDVAAVWQAASGFARRNVRWWLRMTGSDVVGYVAARCLVECFRTMLSPRTDLPRLDRLLEMYLENFVRVEHVADGG